MEMQGPTRRRWYQFSLRAFLSVIVLVGFCGAWVKTQLNRKKQHEAVIHEILNTGGSVGYSQTTPAWKVWAFGRYSVETLSLDLQNTSDTDLLLSQTHGMNCNFLKLSSSKITDAGLTHLKGLTGLKVLVIDNTQITDAGLTHLEGLYSLLVLKLHNAQVTQAGVDSLQKAIPGCSIEFTPAQPVPAHATP